VLVYLHGGGWVVGSLDTADLTARLLCRRIPAVVASVDYRLAPEHPYPAALDDAWAALGWAFERRAELGHGAGAFAVGGDSAGANLAAAVTLLARDRGGPPIDAQLLVYPVTDASMAQSSYDENGTGLLLTRAAMAWFWDLYASPAQRRDPLVCPLLASDLSRLPPAVIATAQYDPLRDEGEAYAARLVDAGVPVVCTRFDGLVHGYLGMVTTVPAADAALDATCVAFAELLAGRPPGEATP
jgi:acetyl esterase